MKAEDDEELLLQCRWHNCCQSFPNYIRLHVHFLECHLNNVPELVCLWDSCQKNDIFQEQNQLLRHTLLHIFFEDCIVNTNKLLKAHHKAWNFVCCGISCQKPAYLQRSTETFLWNTIILNRGFECQWKDCDYTTNSAYLFIEHVKEHDFPYGNDNNNDDCNDEDDNSNTKLTCLWQSLSVDSLTISDQSICGSISGCRSHFHRHVRRHTGLPRYICSKCYVCFAEFINFKEHFTWSLVKDCQNVVKFNGTDENSTDCPILLKLMDESSPFPKHLEGTTIFQCPTCIKVFITKEGWTSHIRECSNSLNKETAVNTKKLDCISLSRKQVSKPYFKIASINKLSEENYEFYCQVQGCSYKSTKLSAYRAHYRRYHLSSNPDGLWYSCHLCSSYQARKPFTITHHLKSVHSLKPPDGRSRFTYSFDECSQTYQLAGKPPAPCTVQALYSNNNNIGTTGPLAPDLDEIIGDSDEENHSDEELLTSAELLKRFYKIWQNEKLAPVLLTAHSDLLGLIQAEVNQLEAEAKALPAGDLKAQIKRIQVERIRFIMVDYMRIRMKKIERFAEHILAEERSRNSNELPHLTVEEYLFAKSYSNSIREYLKTTIINRLPANMQSIKDEELTFHPNPNSYVFCQSLKKIDYIEVFDHSSDGTQTAVSLTLEPGAQHLLPYSCIRPYVEGGDVILI
ncbi:unnamed protein product [Schistosoma bovis]|nr:unnamed protein product [Schistosoma bovis]CAH8584881.1 unnamed protein product [Schistosoma bovis]